MAGRNIKTNLELRLKGWQAAAKSPRTPTWLRASIIRNIRELKQRLKNRKGVKGSI